MPILQQQKSSGIINPKQTGSQFLKLKRSRFIRLEITEENRRPPHPVHHASYTYMFKMSED